MKNKKNYIILTDTRNNKAISGFCLYDIYQKLPQHISMSYYSLKELYMHQIHDLNLKTSMKLSVYDKLFKFRIMEENDINELK
jgi:hypothetical protein